MGFSWDDRALLFWYLVTYALYWECSLTCRLRHQGKPLVLMSYHADQPVTAMEPGNCCFSHRRILGLAQRTTVVHTQTQETSVTWKCVQVTCRRRGAFVCRFKKTWLHSKHDCYGITQKRSAPLTNNCWSFKKEMVCDISIFPYYRATHGIEHDQNFNQEVRCAKLKKHQDN